MDPRLNALVFQDLRTWRVYSCPVDGHEDLSDFSDRELRGLLEIAR